MVCKRLEPGAADWKAHSYPLSYDWTRTKHAANAIFDASR